MKKLKKLKKEGKSFLTKNRFEHTYDNSHIKSDESIINL
jgi:hypothetical protein